MIWRPTVYGPTGIPNLPEAPPSLRVEGDSITSEQRNWAQQAFVNFCTMARLSYGPNPMQAGKLPDGSRYRIVTVGPQTIMQVWPEQDDEEIRGGIGFSLTYLDGGLIPGHIMTDTSGVEQPQTYIATPVERKGTRDSTGNWKVRKVRGYGGGKASFYHPRSRKYLVGMEGNPDGLLAPLPIGSDMVTMTTRANRTANRLEHTPVFTLDKEVAEFRTMYDTLPFFRRNDAGTDLMAVQIVPEFTPVIKLVMYQGRYEPAENTPVGEYRAEWVLPDDWALLSSMISASPDGNRVRVTCRQGGDTFIAVDLGVSDVGFSVVGTQTYGVFIPGFSETTTTGDIVTGQTTIRRANDGASVALEYGYDGKGRGVVARPGTFAGDENGRLFEQITASDVGPIRTEVSTQTISNSDETAITTVMVNDAMLTVPRLTSTIDSNVVTTRVYNWTNNVTISLHTVGTQSIETNSYDAIQLLYVEPTLDFSMQAVRKRHYVLQQHIDSTEPSPPWVTDFEEETYSGAVQVRCAGQVVDDIDVSDILVELFVVSVAADPLTGAVMVNLLQFTDTTRNFVARSWIYVVDDKGAKRLSDIMDVPDSRDIRIRNDRALVSV